LIVNNIFVLGHLNSTGKQINNDEARNVILQVEVAPTVLKLQRMVFQ
jgi:hypothetical protein